MKIILLLVFAIGVLSTSPLFALKAGPKKAAKTIKQLYEVNCSSCHGKNGKGPAEAAKLETMKPVPRDLTDPIWQRLATDQRILEVILEGGRYYGLSNRMPAFKGLLSKPQAAQMVVHVRKLKADSDDGDCLPKK
ncbi:c-type cytochrome [Oligoflexaceae bacterium]|nr:c-type cytochrome [Oligoflexaceae bacterium]